MTDRLFQGGLSDWFLPPSWNPAGVPAAGDTMTITSGTASITAADVTNNPTIDGEQLWIGSSDTATAAGFSADGATFGPGFTIGSTGEGYAALSFVDSVTYAGAMDFATAQGSVSLGLDTLDLTGMISVGNGDSLTLSGGTLDLAGVIAVTDGVLATGTTSLTGSGTIAVGDGGTVAVDGATAGVTLAFTGTSGTIALQDPLNFDGTITGFVTGDTIDLIDSPAYKWSYSATTGILGVYGGDGSSSNPLVARFALSSNTPLSKQQIFVGSDGHGGSLILLATPRTWTGGTSDWYDSANWTTSGTLVANSYPLLGDTAIIAAGTAIMSAADFTTYGTLNDETVQLAGNNAGVEFIQGALGSDLTITAATSQTTTSITIGGSVSSEATMSVSGAGSTLDIAVSPDGTIAGDLMIGLDGTIVIGTESALDLAAGRVTNDGQIIDSGAMTIAAGATLDGSGVINLQYANLTVTVAGTVGTGQQVAFYGDQLNIAQGGSFAGVIEDFANGDTIDLQGVTADYVNYDTATSQLIVRNGGADGAVVASLTIDGNYGTDDFALQSDGNGGVLVTDTITEPTQTFYATLPEPAVLEPGQTISLADLLVQAFGTAALSLPNVAVYSQSAADMEYFSYWDPSNPSLPYWTLNGTVVTPDNLQTIPASEFADVDYVAGNAIQANGVIQIPIAAGDTATAPAYTQYSIQNFGSAFAQPSLDSGAPTPQDVVNAASAFAAAYTGVPNTEDCWNIACEVAAAAGATMAQNTYSTDPEQNVAGGFWRIAYAAPQTGAVSNWSSIVQAGDILRIGWANNGGPHSFTIVAPLNQAGSITVFDNIYEADGYEAIGIHQANYWTTTNASDITIYRLDPNNLYLVDTTQENGTLVQNLPSATTFGTNFNDLIIPTGPDGTISCGGGTDTIADTSTILNGATIQGFGLGDTLDFTDLVYSATSISYDAATGACDVTSGGTLAAELFLPTGLSGTFDISNDGGSASLDGNTLGTIYSSLFTGSTGEGSAVTFVTCFAAGTRVKTLKGDVRVEDLAVGDLVVCADGTQPIVWIGQRAVDIRRHPEPATVLPVRIAAGAFGPALPAQPLFLSPDHAIFAEEVLIPVRYLINGHNVRQQSVARFPRVTYFHIELPEHSVILAEGLPVESYLDTGNRHSFSNGGGLVSLFPDFSPLIWDAQGYAPLVVTGPAVDRVRARLCQRKPRKVQRPATQLSGTC